MQFSSPISVILNIPMINSKQFAFSKFKYKIRELIAKNLSSKLIPQLQNYNIEK